MITNVTSGITAKYVKDIIGDLNLPEGISTIGAELSRIENKMVTLDTQQVITALKQMNGGISIVGLNVRPHIRILTAGNIYSRIDMESGAGTSYIQHQGTVLNIGNSAGVVQTETPSTNGLNDKTVVPLEYLNSETKATYLVHRAGTETITGAKSFSGNNTFSGRNLTTYRTINDFTLIDGFSTTNYPTGWYKIATRSWGDARTMTKFKIYAWANNIYNLGYAEITIFTGDANSTTPTMKVEAKGAIEAQQFRLTIDNDRMMALWTYNPIYMYKAIEVDTATNYSSFGQVINWTLIKSLAKTNTDEPTTQTYPTVVTPQDYAFKSAYTSIPIELSKRFEPTFNIRLPSSERPNNSSDLHMPNLKDCNGDEIQRDYVRLAKNYVLSEKWLTVYKDDGTVYHPSLGITFYKETGEAITRGTTPSTAGLNGVELPTLAYLNNSDKATYLVHKAGTETLTGDKKFTGKTQIDGVSMNKTRVIQTGTSIDVYIKVATTYGSNALGQSITFMYDATKGSQDVIRGVYGIITFSVRLNGGGCWMTEWIRGPRVPHNKFAITYDATGKMFTIWARKGVSDDAIQMVRMMEGGSSADPINDFVISSDNTEVAKSVLMQADNVVFTE